MKRKSSFVINYNKKIALYSRARTVCVHTESKFLADCIKNIDVCKNHGIIIVSFIEIRKIKWQELLTTLKMR